MRSTLSSLHGQTKCQPSGHAAKRVTNGGGGLQHYFQQGAAFGKSFHPQANVVSPGSDDVGVLSLWDTSILDENDDAAGAEDIQYDHPPFLLTEYVLLEYPYDTTEILE